MGAAAYEILALAMRYVFAFLMVLIVLRAWRLTAVDSARAKKLRRLSPETGIIGEMLVLDGGEKARPGMRYPVTLEGTIGSSAGADIRVRHGSVRRRHAYFTMTDEGLFIRGHANARIGADGRWLREAVLRDGDELRLGRVTLMLVLTGADEAPEEINRRMARRRNARRADEEYRSRDEDFGRDFDAGADEGYDNRIFDAPPVDESDPDDFFFSNPASCLSPEEYDEDDGFDEYDNY